MPTGKVKWYDAAKGFGFLSQEDGEDVYVRSSALPEGVEELKAGQRVEFGLATGRRGPQALSLKLIDPPFKPAVNDDGDETGEYVFNFKMPGGFASKKEKDSEGKPKTIAMRPDLFDAKGKPIKNPPPIWGGTVAIVAGELRPFLNPKAECGVSLRLRAVQVIELRSGSGGCGSASEYGFGAEEGYEASDEPSMGDHAPAPDGDDSAPAGGQDF